METAPTISVKRWIGVFLLTAIPIFGIIKLFMWAFGSKAEPNLKTYAKASLLLAAIFLALYAVIMVVVLVLIGQSV